MAISVALLALAAVALIADPWIISSNGTDVATSVLAAIGILSLALGIIGLVVSLFWAASQSRLP